MTMTLLGHTEELHFLVCQSYRGTTWYAIPDDQFGQMAIEDIYEQANNEAIDTEGNLYKVTATAVVTKCDTLSVEDEE